MYHKLVKESKTSECGRNELYSYILSTLKCTFFLVYILLSQKITNTSKKKLITAVIKVNFTIKYLKL